MLVIEQPSQKRTSVAGDGLTGYVKSFPNAIFAAVLAVWLDVKVRRGELGWRGVKATMCEG